MDSSRCTTCASVNVGSCAITSAAAADTKGAAIDVPLAYAYAESLDDQSERMFTPGAARST